LRKPCFGDNNRNRKLMNGNAQYSVLARNRPIRIAFLVDVSALGTSPVQLNDLIDEIVDYNNTHWGGRTNPIIFSQGDDLTASDWRLLELADPDCLLAFAPLPQKLLESLDKRLHPWSIEVDDKSKNPGRGIRLSFETGGVPTPPTPANLARLRGPGSMLADREEKLLMFEFSESCEPDIKRFIHRNFGTFHQWFDPNSKTSPVRRIGWLERLMPKIQTHRIAISDRASLAAALLEMAGSFRLPNARPALPFLAPCQLASLGLAPSWTTSAFQHIYQIVIGDAPDDFAEFWSGIFWSRNWSRTYSSQLWIPTSLMGDAVFHDALLDWLRRYTGCGSNDRRAEPISHSISATEVEKIRQSLHSVAPPIFTGASNPNWLEQRRERAERELAGPDHFVSWDSRTDAIRFACHSDAERFSIPKPDLLDDEFNWSGSWMVDLQVEHISKFQATAREQSWWLLPRRNANGLVQAMFRAPARINREGRFSVSIGSQNYSLSPLIKPEITLSMPNETDVIQWFLRDPSGSPAFTSDVRYKTNQRRRTAISHSRVSEKGANLAGLIDLFGNFWNAKSYCERQFWRRLFSILAGHGPGNDEKLHAHVRTALEKEAFQGIAEASEKSAVLADKILHLVRGRLKGQLVTFKDALQLRSRLEKNPVTEPLTYPQGNTIVQHHGITALSLAEMQDGFNDLLEIGVLRLGIEDTCPGCKISTWCHIDDLRQHLTCSGCGHKHSLRATEKWSYTLNTLAQTGVSQGVMGVLHALTALASQSHTFFIFSPSLELFRDAGNCPWHEVDVLAVANGDFVIGEVKEGYVQKTAFDELAEIAETLLPQRAIIFLPFEHAKKQWSELNEWVRETQARLAPKNISFELFTLPEY
jgi:hypothetical protein